MFREIGATKQKIGEPRKRWFSSETMDCFVWTGDLDNIVCVQLTYNKQAREKALIWQKDSGISFFDVDDGCQPRKHPSTPIFVRANSGHVDNIIGKLMKERGDLDMQTLNFLIGKIVNASI